MAVWQEDLAACLWGTGPLLHTLEMYRVPSAAILRSESGIELAVVHAPRHDLYHVGVIAPKDMYLDETVTPPTSITVHPAAVPAARSVSSALLADYHRAVFQVQLNHLGDDLAWAHEAFEPGTVQDPPQQELAGAFARFAAIAPHIIAALRTNDAHPFNAHEKAFLERMDATFGQPGPASEDPGAAREVPSVDPLALWLTEGDGLVELARAAGRAAPTQSALSVARATAAPRALPSPPVQVAASPSLR
ncbi:hypothetical protein [Streptomyces sp. NBC_01006]|uniref:hypothetical protein n=1 Tax=Streptomyces sp. NBC_01006 TaxID=2903716 RepID=UPI00386A5E33|nr:hypothetical protein OG509_32280 [Streptomyces sp. NBC_01006]